MLYSPTKNCKTFKHVETYSVMWLGLKEVHIPRSITDKVWRKGGMFKTSQEDCVARAAQSRGM